MFVITDTGPLNYLVRLGQESLLSQAYGVIHVPEAVRRELQHPRAPHIVQHWAQSPPPWLKTLRVESGRMISLQLGPGETEAISLALQFQADLLLTDDNAARREAQARGLRVTGTLGILRQAADLNKIQLSTLIPKLLRLGFRARPELVARILQTP